MREANFGTVPPFLAVQLLADLSEQGNEVLRHAAQRVLTEITTGRAVFARFDNQIGDIPRGARQQWSARVPTGAVGAEEGPGGSD